MQTDNATAHVKATAISAFCAHAGLEIAAPKIIAYHVTPPDKANEDNLDLIVHDLHWNPTTIPRQRHREMVYLGMDIALNGDSLGTHISLLQYLRSAIGALHYRKANMEAKVIVLAQQITPKAMYKATKASWPLRIYRKFDKVFEFAWRRIYSLSPTFPTALMYMSPAHSGLGIPKFSEEVQKHKWASLQRNLALGGLPAQEANELIQRACDATYAPPLPDSTHPPIDLFARSILQWAAELGYNLQQHTHTPRHSQGTEDNLETLAQYIREHNLREVFTDGSCMKEFSTPNDLLKDPFELRSRNTGASACVYMSTADNWKEAELNTLVRISYENSEYVKNITPYTMEVIPTLFAHHLACKSGVPTKQYTDCLNIARGISSTDLQNTSSPQKTLALMYTAAATAELADPNYQVDWVRSHPERRTTDRNKWTTLDYGIFLADALAEDDRDTIATILPPKTSTTFHFHIDDIWNAIIPPNFWRWTDPDGFYFLDSLSQPAEVSRVRAYLCSRDQYRASANKPPVWEHSAIGISHKALQPPKRQDDREPSEDYDAWHYHRHTTRRTNTMTVYDKSYTNGRVRAHFQKPDDEHDFTQCALCHQPDSLTHLILECPDKHLDAIRTEAKTNQVACLQAIKRETSISPMRDALENFVASCWPDIEMQEPLIPRTQAIRTDLTSRYWRGLLNPDMIAQITKGKGNERISNAEYTLLQTNIIHLTRPLLKALKNMNKYRARAYFNTLTPSHHTATPPREITTPLTRNTITEMFRKYATTHPAQLPQTSQLPNMDKLDPQTALPQIIKERRTGIHTSSRNPLAHERKF